ncbi:MAG TPA: CPBP family intramembrane glutamic endopeptidase [Methylomirabilota bacterium]
MVAVSSELVALWVVLPILLWNDTLPVVYRIAVLVVAAAYALWIVWFEQVRWDELGFRGVIGLLPSFAQGAAWIAASLPVLAATTIAIHGLASLGSLPTSSAESLLVLLLFYASVSVTSQEFLYSSFFFWRYRPLFSPGFLVGLNAVVFAVAHLVYHSWVSVFLALAGRVIMARIYRRHGSFWGVWTVHLLFGVLVFLVGLGRYFYRSAG